MKNPIVLTAICFLFMLMSCAELKQSAKIENNLFQLSYPHAQVEISKDFSYLGSGEFNNFDKKFYSFISKDTKNQNVRKGVFIAITNIVLPDPPRSWRIGFSVDKKNKYLFDYDLIKQNDKSYEYYVYIASVYDDDQDFTWLNKMGYTFSECLLQYKLVNVGLDIFEAIVYFEDATLSGYDCCSWPDKNNLTEKHKKYIQQFKERANKAVKIIDF